MFQIFLGRDNTVGLQLQNNKLGGNLANVDKIVIDIDDVVIDSSDPENESEGYVTWTSVIPDFNEPNLILKLGTHPDLQSYSGVREMRITVYDYHNPDGLVWLNQVCVKIIPDSV